MTEQLSKRAGSHYVKQSTTHPAADHDGAPCAVTGAQSLSGQGGRM